jgi:hypothetical protein
MGMNPIAMSVLLFREEVSPTVRQLIDESASLQRRIPLHRETWRGHTSTPAL